MQIQFLGQGYEPKSEYSVGNQLIKLFAEQDFHTFTGISAFTSQAGINGLSKHIDAARKYFKKITIVTGVDQKVTSKEALEALLALKINAYVFYEPSKSIFHPKIYLFEGIEKSELIIGSSNLTSKGLFTNVETSIRVSIDNNIDEDCQIVNQLKDYFLGIFDLSDPNLKKISKKLINDLVNLKIVSIEAERIEAQDKSDKTESKETEKVISKIFPKRTVAKIPTEFRGTQKPASKTKVAKNIVAETLSPKSKLVWTRMKLPSSSIQGGASGTNPTGGLRLVQAKFIFNGARIDQTSYFRYTLFGSYPWEQVREKPYVEAAMIPFELTIFGEYKGKFDLEVRHKPSGEAGQHNYTTSISWGNLGETIQETNLTGSRLDLYSPDEQGNPFHIIIS